MTVYDVSPKSPAAPRTIRTIPAKPKSRKHLRVAAYCRVSKDSDGLKHSFNAQVNYYKEKILRNPTILKKFPEMFGILTEYVLKWKNTKIILLKNLKYYLKELSKHPQILETLC